VSLFLSPEISKGVAKIITSTLGEIDNARAPHLYDEVPLLYHAIRCANLEPFFELRTPYMKVV
jgi:hypothetical protein